eukprot:gene30988-41250_t
MAKPHLVMLDDGVIEALIDALEQRLSVDGVAGSGSTPDLTCPTVEYICFSTTEILCSYTENRANFFSKRLTGSQPATTFNLLTTTCCYTIFGQPFSRTQFSGHHFKISGHLLAGSFQVTLGLASGAQLAGQTTVTIHPQFYSFQYL